MKKSLRVGGMAIVMIIISVIYSFANPYRIVGVSGVDVVVANMSPKEAQTATDRGYTKYRSEEEFPKGYFDQKDTPAPQAAPVKPVVLMGTPRATFAKVAK